MVTYILVLLDTCDCISFKLSIKQWHDNTKQYYAVKCTVDNAAYIIVMLQKQNVSKLTLFTTHSLQFCHTFTNGTAVSNTNTDKKYCNYLQYYNINNHDQLHIDATTCTSLLTNYQVKFHIQMNNKCIFSGWSWSLVSTTERHHFTATT